MPRILRKSWLLFLLGAILLTSCGGPKQNKTSSPEAGKAAPTASAKGDPAKVAWDELKEAAKKEGQVVVIMSTGGNVLEGIRKAWEKQNFGVDLKIMAMKGPELGGKLKAERKSNLYTIDNLIYGTETLINVIKPMGALDPVDDKLILPEVKDPSKWFENKLTYVDKEKTILVTNLGPKAPIFINTSKVSLQDVKSYQDILKPEFKGKVVLNDPRVTGSGVKWFGTMVNFQILNKDYFEKLKNQIVPLSKDEVLQAQGLAQGKYLVGLGLNEAEITKLIKAGSPLAFVTPQEGTYMTSAFGQLTYMNKAPHPNAAKLFANWFLTKEVQSIFTPLMAIQSLRLDVPTTGLPETNIRKPGAKYFNPIVEEIIKKQPEVSRLAEEIFGSLK